MTDTPKVHPLKYATTRDARRPEARDIETVVVEVELHCPKVVGAHFLLAGISRVETYRDDLPGMLSEVRTPEHEEQKRRAQAMVASIEAEFREEHASALERMTTEAAEKWIFENFLVGWVSMLPLCGGSRRGIPNILSAAVVAHDERRTVPLAEFLELDPVEQRAFLRAPPPIQGGGNATKIANAHIAAVLKRAMARRS